MAVVNEQQMHIEWCQQLMASLRLGGEWTVPRSGLVFRKTAPDILTLVRRLGPEAAELGRRSHWRDYQDEDFDIIQHKFGVAGYNVERGAEVSEKQWLDGEFSATDMIASRDEFFQAAVTDRMDDEFHAILRRNPETEPDRGFSVEGYQSVGYQMHDFVMARSLAFWNRTGKPPNSVRAELRLVFNDDDDATDELLAAKKVFPWYAVDDLAGEPIPLDGGHRLEPFLEARDDV